MTQPPQFNNVQESTTRDLGFKTSSLTGSGSQDSKGQDFAKLLLTGIKAVGTVIDANYTANQREITKKNQLIAQSEQDDAVFLQEKKKKFEQYQVENDYASKSGEEQILLTNSFYDADRESVVFKNEKSGYVWDTYINSEIQKHQTKRVSDAKNNLLVNMVDTTKYDPDLPIPVEALKGTTEQKKLIPDYDTRNFDLYTKDAVAVIRSKANSMIQEKIWTKEEIDKAFPFALDDEIYKNYIDAEKNIIMSESIKYDKEKLFGNLRSAIVNNPYDTKMIDGIVNKIGLNHGMDRYSIMTSEQMTKAIKYSESQMRANEIMENGTISGVYSYPADDKEVALIVNNNINKMIGDGVSVEKVLTVADRANVEVEYYKQMANRVMSSVESGNIDKLDWQTFSQAKRVYNDGGYKDQKTKDMFAGISYVARVLNYNLDDEQQFRNAVNAYSAHKALPKIVNQKELYDAVEDKFKHKYKDLLVGNKTFGIKEKAEVMRQVEMFAQFGIGGSDIDSMVDTAVDNVTAISERTGGHFLGNTMINTSGRYKKFVESFGGEDNIKTITDLGNGSVYIRLNNNKSHTVSNAEIDNILKGKPNTKSEFDELLNITEKKEKALSKQKISYDNEIITNPGERESLLKLYGSTEDKSSIVYRDTNKNKYRTVGYGFNLDQEGARDLWKKFEIKENFDDVANGKQLLSDASSERLLFGMHRLKQNQLKSDKRFDHKKLNKYQTFLLTDVLYNYGHIDNNMVKIAYEKDPHKAFALYNSFRPKGDTRGKKLESFIGLPEKIEVKKTIDTGKNIDGIIKVSGETKKQKNNSKTVTSGKNIFGIDKANKTETRGNIDFGSLDKNSLIKVDRK